MNKKEGRGILGTVLALGLVAAAPAAAQDSGVYLGASLGTGESTSVCEGIVGSCDDNDTAYRLFGGYQMNRNFAWELGYASLGDEEAEEVAAGLWERINLVNLHENIVPTRPRADLILRKDPQHAVKEVALRKV